MQSQTLIDYSPGFANEVRAFSTTRIPPKEFNLTPEEKELMGSYAAFNVTHYCNDVPARVQRCRDWLCKELSIDNRHFVLPRQTHGNRIVALGSEFLTASDEERANLLNNADGLITDIPGLCIGISTADCVPLLLYIPDRHIAAAIHAGWRGTVNNIAQRAVQEAIKRFNVKPAGIHAIIGPSISQHAFEVGEEVVEAFAAAGFPMEQIMKRMGNCYKAHIDLWAANYLQLLESGLSIQHIQVAGICSYTHHDRFFSARRLGINSGRTYTGIML